MRKVKVLFLCSLMLLGSFGVLVDPLLDVGRAIDVMAYAAEEDGTNNKDQTTDTDQPVSDLLYGSPQKGWYCSSDIGLIPGREYRFTANNGSSVVGQFIGFTRGIRYFHGPVYCKRVIYRPRLKKAPR